MHESHKVNEYSINASEINISFDGVQVLHDVDFQVKRGEVHALVGSNGAGKSTLMKIISRVYKQDSGRITVFGKKITQGALQSGIAMVFQDLSLIPSLTVSENIFLQTHPYRKGLLIDDSKAKEKARELMKTVGVDAEISPGDRVEDLSIGEQQVVEIAKALSNNPRVLILDEPTASLSNTEIEKLFAVIRKLKENNMSIIYITHYLQDIFKVCDCVTILRDGKVVCRENTTDIDLQFLVDSMIGGKAKAVSWERKTKSRTGSPLLDVRNISTSHVEDISLKVYSGEIVGLAGLLGSGRSELLRALFGIDKLKKGLVRLGGNDINISSSTEAIGYGISMVPENRREEGLVLDFSVSENLVLPIISRLKKFLIVDRRKINSMVTYYIDLLGVKARGPEQVVRFLSGGNQQKIVVAKCLASHSKILLLDDPTFGVDIHAKHEIMRIIEEYVSKGNAALFVSSEFNEIADFCDSAYVMKKGKITYFIEGSMSEDELLCRVQ